MSRCINFGINFLIFIYLFTLCNSIECPGDHLCKGRCELFGNLKYCICDPGETNWDCKTELDLCNRDCIIDGNTPLCSKLLCNYGTCNNILTEPYYMCDCGPFYTGDNCNIENTPCSSINTNPCSNGTCEFIQGINKINCHCNPGWKPRDSETSYTIDWKGIKIVVDPPCIEKAFYGISKIAPHLSQGTRSIWYIIFGILSLFFMWQFYMLCINIASIRSNKAKDNENKIN